MIHSITFLFAVHMDTPSLSRLFIYIKYGSISVAIGRKLTKKKKKAYKVCVWGEEVYFSNYNWTIKEVFDFRYGLVSVQ